MKKTIPISGLKRWKENYTNNKDLRVVTESSVISLELLEKFIKEAKTNSPGFNGVRIYFIRYDESDGLNANRKHIRIAGTVAGKDFSQVSLAFVPVKNFDPVTLAGDDFELANNQIFTLAFCEPKVRTSGTGHCPPCKP